MRCTGTHPKTGLACVVGDLRLGDRCCWSCGKPLASALALVSQAIPTLTRPPVESCPGCHKAVKPEELKKGVRCPHCSVTCVYADPRSYFLVKIPNGAVCSHIGIGTPKNSGANEDYGIV